LVSRRIWGNIVFCANRTDTISIEGYINTKSGNNRGKDKPMNISYAPRGDYLLPNIRLKEPPPVEAEALGRYARMRRVYLKTHRHIYYNQLLLSERLFPLLREMDKTAQERRERGVSEEVILDELVYE